jgi:hypothetical protein
MLCAAGDSCHSPEIRVLLQISAFDERTGLLGSPQWFGTIDVDRLPRPLILCQLRASLFDLVPAPGDVAILLLLTSQHANTLFVA